MIRSGLVLGLVLVSGGAAFAADARQGLIISQRWCSACHVVSSDQKTGSTEVPPFSDIAKRRTDARELSAFIAEPHPKMPSMSLSREEIADIVQYIRSLNPALDWVPMLDKDVKPEEPRRG